MKTKAGLPGVVVIEGHVQGLANTRALGKAGIPVIVVSEFNSLAHYSRYCKKFLKCPPYLSEDFIDFLIDLAISESIKDWILFPSNDHAVFNISTHSERLRDHYRIISPGLKILNTIYNKELLIKLCQSIDIPVPESWFPETPDDIKLQKLKFPLLIKGKNGLTFYKRMGKKAYLVDSYEKLWQAVDLILEKCPFSGIYLQNLLPVEKCKPVSFTAFSIDGEIKAYWMGMKIREHPMHFGTATYSRNTYDPALIPLAEKLLGKLKFSGVCEIEFLFDPRDNKYKLIEVNSRTWLWVDMAIKSGINYPIMVYNYLNNIDMNYPCASDKSFEWIHYLTDIPYSLLGIVKGDYSFSEIIRSYSKLPSPAVFDSSDILPSFAEIVLMPLLILKR